MWLMVLCGLPLAIWLGGAWLASLPERNARAEFAAGRPARAKAWLLWGTRWGLGGSETEFLLARAARKLGDPGAFQGSLERARQRGYSSKMCEREAVLAEAQAGRLSAAERQMTTIFDGPHGESAEASEALANGYAVTMQVDRAKQILGAWQADYPNHAQPHYLQGLIWRNLRSEAQAEASFRQALAVDSGHAAATHALGDLYLAQRRLDEALEYYARSERFPEFRETALIGQARARRYRGETATARRLLSQLAGPAASSAVAFEMGQLELESADYTAACKWLEQAFQQDTKNAEVRYQLALALAAAGRKPDADAHFEFAERDRDLRSRLTHRMFQAGVEPRNWERRVEIGRLSLERGSPEEALVWLHSALEIDPNCRPAHQLLADYYEQRKDESPEFARLATRHRRLSLESN